AITINMTYSNEGNPVPHDENPSWDPVGICLKAHFAAAKAIWESLLPGSGDISFDFEWDADINDPPGRRLTGAGAAGHGIKDDLSLPSPRSCKLGVRLP